MFICWSICWFLKISEMHVNIFVHECVFVYLGVRVDECVIRHLDMGVSVHL